MADETDVRDFDIKVGFSKVDNQPDPGVLAAGMDATAQWPAVRRLRVWERERLALASGERLVDVGCGTGDVMASLAADLGDSGAAIGVDTSQTMLAVAQQRFGDRPGLSFEVGDATALPMEDGSVDACRSERTLQWIPQPEEAVAEMVRVLRPGGRLVVIDTDWRSMVFDLVPQEVQNAVYGALRSQRGPSAEVGRRLVNLCRDAGLQGIDVTAATHVWTDCAVTPMGPHPSGLFPMRPILGAMVAAGLLEPQVAESLIDTLTAAADDQRFFGSLTMYAVAARRA